MRQMRIWVDISGANINECILLHLPPAVVPRRTCLTSIGPAISVIKLPTDGFISIICRTHAFENSLHFPPIKFFYGRMGDGTFGRETFRIRELEA